MRLLMREGKVRLPLRTMTALAAAALLPVLGAKAESAPDLQTYWYGYYMGAAQTVCALLKHGQLANGYAETLLSVIAKGDKDVPQVSIDQAFTELAKDKDHKDCPLPRK